MCVDVCVCVCARCKVLACCRIVLYMLFVCIHHVHKLYYCDYLVYMFQNIILALLVGGERTNYKYNNRL